MKALNVLVLAVACASVFGALAMAAQPCSRAVIDDWYDNGTIDQGWDCACLGEALRALPEDLADSSVRDDFERQLELRRCDALGEPIVTMTFTQPPGPGSDKSISVDDDSFPWEVAIVGGVALGLAGLVAVAVYRQRRQRSA